MIFDHETHEALIKMAKDESRRRTLMEIMDMIDESNMTKRSVLMRDLRSKIMSAYLQTKW